MKKAVTFRIDAALLERARQSADADNRTLTNFVETALKRATEDMTRPLGMTPSSGSSIGNEHRDGKA